MCAVLQQGQCKCGLSGLPPLKTEAKHMQASTNGMQCTALLRALDFKPTVSLQVLISAFRMHLFCCCRRTAVFELNVECKAQLLFKLCSVQACRKWQIYKHRKQPNMSLSLCDSCRQGGFVCRIVNDTYTSYFNDTYNYLFFTLY